MYIPRIREDLLRRPSRRQRRRRWLLIAVVLVLVALAIWRWFPRGPRPTLSVPGTTSETLLNIEPPRIVIPPSLDEYLTGTEGEAQATQARRTHPREVAGAVVQGQPLFDALTSQGVPAHSIRPVINAVGEHFDFRRSRVGDRFEVDLDDEGTINRFRYQSVPEVYYEARLVGPGEYQALRHEVPLDIETLTLVGTVTGSLYSTVRQLGESDEIARRLVEIFQWDIDFSRDARPGDAFRMIYEKVSLNGEFLRYGRILAVEYRGARSRERAYWFDGDTRSGYFSSEGQPLERMFLRAPCSYRRISSGFNLARMHPVLGRVKPHLGVDFAADTGTPVRAVADGEVEFAGFRGAAGNMVAITHAHGYRTAYAHLHTIARGLKRGDRVRQGQVIGTVGNTGRSTGAHLHFAVKHNGNFIDPLQHRDQRLPGLKGRELQEYMRVRDRLQFQLDEHPLPHVAVDTRPAEYDIPIGGDHEEEEDVYAF